MNPSRLPPNTKGVFGATALSPLSPKAGVDVAKETDFLAADLSGAGVAPKEMGTGVGAGGGAAGEPKVKGTAAAGEGFAAGVGAPPPGFGVSQDAQAVLSLSFQT